MSGTGEPPIIERDVVFYRALVADSRGDARLTEADRMLSAMLTFDAVCVGDGVLPALYCHSPAELDSVLSGYRYFGLNDVADVIESIAARVDDPPDGDQLEFEVGLEEEYESVCPETAVHAAFTRFYQDRGHEFAAVSDRDLAQHRSLIEFIRRI
jgi:hypothetical protein